MVSLTKIEQAIVGFHQDEFDDWVADLACGHGQHVRHQPPWQNRPWVITAKGRASRMGKQLRCKKCERGESIE
jgi:cytochrome c-type biogenesis protein CcmH/NrfF